MELFVVLVTTVVVLVHGTRVKNAITEVVLKVMEAALVIRKNVREVLVLIYVNRVVELMQDVMVRLQEVAVHLGLVLVIMTVSVK